MSDNLTATLRSRAAKMRERADLLYARADVLDEAAGRYFTLIHEPSDSRFRTILALVAKHCAIDSERIMSGSRESRVAGARHLLEYVLRCEGVGMTFSDVGKIVGRDHSSCIHGFQSVEKRMKEQPAFAISVARLMDAVRLACGGPGSELRAANGVQQ